MADLKPIKYSYSLGERLFGRLNFLFLVKFGELFRKTYKTSSSIQVDREIEAKTLSKKEYVFTCYFTKLKDPIKGIVRNNPDFKYIAPWYNSMMSLGLNGVIVHDGLTEEFIKEYENEKITFVKYVPGKYSIFEERWMAYYLLLTSNNIEKVFLTDSNDVTVNKNPFEAHKFDGKLFVGRDRANRVGDSEWIVDEMNLFIKESGYNVNPIVLHQILFNAGILGGEKVTVIEIIQRIIELTLMAQSDHHKDMSLLNIAISEVLKPKVSTSFYQDKIVDPKNDPFSKQEKLTSGFPLNSEFQQLETNSKATFTHK